MLSWIVCEVLLYLSMWLVYEASYYIWLVYEAYGTSYYIWLVYEASYYIWLVYEAYGTSYYIWLVYEAVAGYLYMASV